MAPTANPPVSVRVSPSERDLLEAAAAHARTTLSDFVRRKALEAAELDLMDRRIVTIPAAAWEQFEAWAQARPSRSRPCGRWLQQSPYGRTDRAPSAHG